MYEESRVRRYKPRPRIDVLGVCLQAWEARAWIKAVRRQWTIENGSVILQVVVPAASSLGARKIGQFAGDVRSE